MTPLFNYVFGLQQSNCIGAKEKEKEEKREEIKQGKKEKESKKGRKCDEKCVLTTHWH